MADMTLSQVRTASKTECASTSILRKQSAIIGCFSYLKHFLCKVHLYPEPTVVLVSFVTFQPLKTGNNKMKMKDHFYKSNTPLFSVDNLPQKLLLATAPSCVILVWLLQEDFYYIQEHPKTTGTLCNGENQKKMIREVNACTGHKHNGKGLTEIRNTNSLGTHVEDCPKYSGQLDVVKVSS